MSFAYITMDFFNLTGFEIIGDDPSNFQFRINARKAEYGQFKRTFEHYFTKIRSWALSQPDDMYLMVAHLCAYLGLNAYVVMGVDQKPIGLFSVGLVGEDIHSRYRNIPANKYVQIQDNQLLDKIRR